MNWFQIVSIIIIIWIASSVLLAAGWARAGRARRNAEQSMTLRAPHTTHQN